MKKIISLALLSLLIGGATQLYAQIKVKEASASKKPVWVGSTQNDYIVTSAINPDMEKAKNQCMDNVRKYIIESVAQNVKSSDISTIDQESVNSGVVSFLDKYAYTYQTEAAKVPFMTGVSVSKIEDFYWEKQVDKKSGAVNYLYSIKYPFPRLELKKLVDEFRTRDEQMEAKLSELEQGFGNITSVEQIDKAVNDMPVLIEYFFDDTRKNSAKALSRNYANLYNNLSIHRSDDQLGKEIITLRLDGRPISYSKAPVLKSETLAQLQASEQDAAWIITYDYSACDPTGTNAIDVLWKAGPKSVKTKLFVDIAKDTPKIRPQKDIQLDAKVKNGSQVSDIAVRLSVMVDDQKPYTITNLVLDVPELGQPLNCDDLKIEIKNKGINTVSCTNNQSFTCKDKTYVVNNILKGYMDVLDETGVMKRINFSLPYTKNW